MYVLFNIFVKPNNILSACLVEENSIIITTIHDDKFQLLEKDRDFKIYQPALTTKLDNYSNKFDQNVINEIVLWKVNRYAEIGEEVLEQINLIKVNSKTLNIDLTSKILSNLLDKATKGIQLPMASAILRFRNPKIYQIIDQRVYRIIYGENFTNVSRKLKTQELIDLYIKYLRDLRVECLRLSISFEIADRVLYNADKRLNRENRLNNYG